MWIDILIITKNNENYWNVIFPLLYRRIQNINVRWLVYENNSTDDTKQILKKLAKIYRNIILKLENTQEMNNKYYNICQARENSRLWYQKLKSKSDKIFLLDTNILFNETSLLNLIDCLEDEYKLVTSFTSYLTLDYDETGKQEKYLYDKLAYNYGKYFGRNKQNISWEKIMIDNAELNNFYVDTQHNLKCLVVESNFAGLGLLASKNFESISWEYQSAASVNNSKISSSIICEHWNYCQKIKKLGKIIICKKSNTIWLQNHIYSKEEIKELLQS